MGAGGQARQRQHGGAPGELDRCVGHPEGRGQVTCRCQPAGSGDQPGEGLVGPVRPAIAAARVGGRLELAEAAEPDEQEQPRRVEVDDQVGVGSVASRSASASRASVRRGPRSRPAAGPAPRGRRRAGARARRRQQVERPLVGRHTLRGVAQHGAHDVARRYQATPGPLGTSGSAARHSASKASRRPSHACTSASSRRGPGRGGARAASPQNRPPRVARPVSAHGQRPVASAGPPGRLGRRAAGAGDLGGDRPRVRPPPRPPRRRRSARAARRISEIRPGGLGKQRVPEAETRLVPAHQVRVQHGGLGPRPVVEPSASTSGGENARPATASSSISSRACRGRPPTLARTPRRSRGAARSTAGHARAPSTASSGLPSAFAGAP